MCMCTTFDLPTQENLPPKSPRVASVQIYTHAHECTRVYETLSQHTTNTHPGSSTGVCSADAEMPDAKHVVDRPSLSSARLWHPRSLLYHHLVCCACVLLCLLLACVAVFVWRLVSFSSSLSQSLFLSLCFTAYGFYVISLGDTHASECTTHACTHRAQAHTHTHTHTHAQKLTDTYTHTGTHEHKQKQTHTQHTCTHACTHTYTLSLMRFHAHHLSHTHSLGVCVNRHIYIYIYIYLSIYTCPIKDIHI